MRAVLCYRCMHVSLLDESDSCDNCATEDPTVLLSGYQLDGYFIKDADTLEDIIRSKIRNKIELSSSETLFLMERGQDEDSERHPYEI